MSFFTDLAGNDATGLSVEPKTSAPTPVPAPTVSTSPREEVSNFRDEHIFPSIFPAFPPQKLPLLMPGHTRLVVVWGHDELGKNMSVFQYGDEYLLVDAGLQIPEDARLGAKFCLPDISFLLPLKEKIVGILITNGHLDHIGGLRYILPALGYPQIFGTKLAMGFVARQMEEAGLKDAARLTVIDPDTTPSFTVGKSFQVSFFRENYTIPDACGLCIQTPHARIVHTWDFKFDFSPSIDRPVDINAIAKIGDLGVDLLLSDSANSLQEGLARTEASIEEELDAIIGAHRGRVILATFPSMIGRIAQVAKIAKKHGRLVYPSSRYVMDGLTIGKDLGFITEWAETLRSFTTRIDEVPAEKQIIITTGVEGEMYSGIYRMIHGEHPVIHIQSGDGVIISTASVQSNSPMLTETMNELTRQGAVIYQVDGLDLHSAGHAAKEEQKLMLNLIRPKYFIPVHGELFLRMEHKKTAQSLGVASDRTFLTDNGDIVDIDENGFVMCGAQKIRLEEIIVDGHGIGLAKSHVIDARRQMGKSGVVIIVFRVKSDTREIDGPLRIETRGVAYLDEAREIHRLIIQKAKVSYSETVKDVPDIEEKDLVKIIKKDVESSLAYKIDREPIVIPVIISI